MRKQSRTAGRRGCGKAEGKELGNNSQLKSALTFRVRTRRSPGISMGKGIPVKGTSEC